MYFLGSLIISLLFILVLFNLKLIHPIYLFIGINSILFVGYRFVEYNSLNDNTVILFIITMFMFALGYLTYLFFNQDNGHHRNISKRYIIKTSHSIIFVFVIIYVLVSYTYIGISNGLSGPSKSFLLNLRLVHLENPGKFGFSQHLILISQVFILINYLQRDIKDIRYLFYFVLLTSYTSFWKMERSGILMSLLTVMIISSTKQIVIKKNKLPYKKLIILLLVIIILFILISMGRDNASFMIATDALIRYFFKNLQSFNDYVIDSNLVGDYSYYWGKIGEVFITKLFPYEKHILAVDGTTNTYTFLIGPYIFGGSVLTYLTFFCIGFLYAIIYNNVIQEKIDWIIFYSFYSFNIIMSFFSYTYAFNNWIYYILIILFFNIILKKEIIYE